MSQVQFNERVEVVLEDREELVPEEIVPEAHLLNSILVLQLVLNVFDSLVVGITIVKPQIFSVYNKGTFADDFPEEVRPPNQIALDCP